MEDPEGDEQQHEDPLGEPLLHHHPVGEFLVPEEGGEFQMQDEQRCEDVADLLDDLRALEDLENGGGMEVIDEEADVYKMHQLIEDKPRDVLHYIEEEGVIKLGEFDVQDTLAFKIFNKKAMLTVGNDHLDCDWESMWRDVLNDRLEATHARVQAGWSTTLRLEAHAVKIRDAAAPGSKGLLQPLLKRYQARGCPVSVFGLPAVQAVIHFKWTTWAARLLGYELMLYAIWLLTFITFSLLFEGEDDTMSLLELLETPKGLAAVMCDAVALVAMVPFLYMELCTIATYGLGWVNLWNSLDVITYILQVSISSLHLMRFDIAGNWFSVLVATQHLMLWSKMHYYARVFNPTKNLLADTFILVLDDTKWFLLYLMLTMLGFMFAFFSLFRQDHETVNDFKTLWHSFASMFSYLLAMFDLNVLYNSTNPAASMVLFVMYEFIMNIMLLNIMIAIMARSFDKVINDQGLRFLSSRAQVIDELEATMPRWFMSKSWYPPFIHILKIHPGSAYEVNLSSVWSSMGLMEDNLLNAHQETRRRLDQMEVDLSQANAELDLMIGTMMDLAQQSFEGHGRDPVCGAGGNPGGCEQQQHGHGRGGGARELGHQSTWSGPRDRDTRDPMAWQDDGGYDLGTRSVPAWATGGGSAGGGTRAWSSAAEAGGAGGERDGGGGWEQAGPRGASPPPPPSPGPGGGGGGGREGRAESPLGRSPNSTRGVSPSRSTTSSVASRSGAQDLRTGGQRNRNPSPSLGRSTWGHPVSASLYSDSPGLRGAGGGGGGAGGGFARGLHAPSPSRAGSLPLTPPSQGGGGAGGGRAHVAFPPPPPAAERALGRGTWGFPTGGGNAQQ